MVKKKTSFDSTSCRSYLIVQRASPTAFALPREYAGANMWSWKDGEEEPLGGDRRSDVLITDDSIALFPTLVQLWFLLSRMSARFGSFALLALTLRRLFLDFR